MECVVGTIVERGVKQEEGEEEVVRESGRRQYDKYTSKTARKKRWDVGRFVWERKFKKKKKTGDQNGGNNQKVKKG